MTDTVNEIDTPEEMEVEKEKLAGSRKLVMAGVVLAIGLGVVLIRGDLPTNLLNLLEVVFGGFVLGNVAGHALGVSLEHAQLRNPQVTPPIETKVEESVDLTPQDFQMPESHVQDTLDKHTQALDIIQQTLLMIIKKSGLDK